MRRSESPKPKKTKRGREWGGGGGGRVVVSNYWKLLVLIRNV